MVTGKENIPTKGQIIVALFLSPFGYFLCWETYTLASLVAQDITVKIPAFFYLLDIFGVFFFIHLARNIIGPYMGWKFKRYDLYQRWTDAVCRVNRGIKPGKEGSRDILKSGIGFDPSDPNSDSFWL